jgi:hypothetical protein
VSAIDLGRAVPGPEGTLETLYRIIAWSFECLGRGKWPEVGVCGTGMCVGVGLRIRPGSSRGPTGAEGGTSCNRAASKLRPLQRHRQMLVAACSPLGPGCPRSKHMALAAANFTPSPTTGPTSRCLC